MYIFLCKIYVYTYIDETTQVQARFIYTYPTLELRREYLHMCERMYMQLPHRDLKRTNLQADLSYIRTCMYSYIHTSILYIDTYIPEGVGATVHVPDPKTGITFAPFSASVLFV